MSFAARVVRIILAAAPAAAVAACGTAQPSEAVVVRDSAGVRIVENFRPEWPEGQGWKIESQPAFILEEALEVTGVALLGDGTVAVLDAMGHRLHLYDAGGELRASVGQDGSGPGELRSPRGISRYRSDSMAVFDRTLGRISVFASSGAFVRSVPVRFTGSRMEFVGALADGSFVLWSAGFQPDQGTWREPATFFRLDSIGEAMDTLFVVPGEEFYGSRFRGRPIYGPLPFGRRTVSAAQGGAEVLNTGEDCALAVRDPDGRKVMEVYRRCGRRVVSRAAVEAFEATRLAGLEYEPARELVAAVYAAKKVPYPNVGGPIDRILIDDTGHIWAEDYVLPIDTVRSWSVFRSDGRLLGTVVMPGNLEIEQIGADRVVGVTRNSAGVARVQVHPLVRATQTQGTHSGAGSKTLPR